jgi:hypothetical protein
MHQSCNNYIPTSGHGVGQTQAENLIYAEIDFVKYAPRRQIEQNANCVSQMAFRLYSGILRWLHGRLGENTIGRFSALSSAWKMGDKHLPVWNYQVACRDFIVAEKQMSCQIFKALDHVIPWRWSQARECRTNWDSL